MNDITHEHHHLPAEDLATIATDALKRRLAQQMELSARHLVEMAAIWTELERRGEDLSALRTGLTDYLPRIAAGELDAQAVVQFAGNRQLLRYLATLPIDRQQQLIEQGEIEVVLPESGERGRRKLAHLSGREVNQVFGQGIVRTPEQQAQLIESKRATRAAKPKADRSSEAMRLRYGTLEVDGERVTSGGKPVRAEQLLSLLSDHYGVNLADLVGRSRKA